MQRLINEARQIFEGKLSMGTWGGQEHFWPDVDDFTCEPQKYDRFGSAYEVIYYYDRDIPLGVECTPMSPGEPSEWVARCMGETRKGKVDRPDALAQVMANALQWAKGLFDKLVAHLKKISSANWTINIDGTDFEAHYKNPNPKSETWLTVSLFNVLEAQDAMVSFAMDSDYQGHIGKQSASIPYSGDPDTLPALLKKAEALWTKWNKY